jgi:hypothetical protein
VLEKSAYQALITGDKTGDKPGPKPKRKGVNP